MRDWDLMIPYVLFRIREVPQASTGFTPFELLFGRQPRGLLDVAREAWEQQQPTPLRSVVEHVREMREGIERAQWSQQRLYNRAAQPREFQPGDKVMVLAPTTACKFLATWQGPYTVIEQVGPVTYRLRQPSRRQEEQLHHVNLLKKWKTELQHLVSQFSTRSGQTNVIEHDIRTPPGVIVRQRPYRVPKARRQAIEDEISEMLKLGVIEPSRSAWSSPIVMVPKPDGTLRFCNDFRCLNQVLEFDSYPLPRTDASNTGLGAVLFQVRDGEEHPVIYISWKLTPAETRYAAVEREALAIKWAVLELWYYLLGRRFTLMTDHAPLQWLASAKDTNARVTRWFLALQDFHFSVEQRAGATNANTDGLSRLWSAFAGLSGHTPRPPLCSPFCLTKSHSRSSATLRGGECGKPPERSSASPWKQTQTSCTRLAPADQSAC
ncbi:Retrovirus-related Pol polyprotein from transposon 17.6 [Labeo rohita]|uniref:Retrovirus-related Pol polyprotein from transposon 17.6 n=1 Tax=Labeo rohita TaxID=84645 RepID=A0ABQ8L1B2_LABRO|nr:Retrovirus-related Pol polyprotein from transposon 17.6 [Labeo rohita]